MAKEQVLLLAEEKDEKEEKKDEKKAKFADLNDVFNPNRDDTIPSYVDDGNPELYSEENFAKRNELKNNPIVKDAITDVKILHSL